MTNKRDLTFAQMFNLSFGFFGVQIAYALQSANISRIFATLGADPHQLSFFWILPPLMGMIVQPLIGKWSDRTWTRMGRRKPYLLVGAIVAVLVMLLLPKAGSLNLSTAYLFLGLNSAMWFGLFSLIFLDTSINVAMQPFKMMVGDLVNEKQKATAYSIQSFLCNAGSLVGYLFPIFFTWIGIANTAPEGVVPDSVIYSFWCGARIRCSRDHVHDRRTVRRLEVGRCRSRRAHPCMGQGRRILVHPLLRGRQGLQVLRNQGMER